MNNGVVDQIIDICWEKTTSGSLSISIDQILSIIQELERLLSTRSLFKSDEIQMLKQMSLRPTSQLQKEELSGFLAKLAQAPDLETLFLERSRLNRFQLLRIVDDYKLNNRFRQDIRKPLSSYNFRNTFSKFELPKLLDFTQKMPSRVPPPVRTSRPASAISALNPSRPISRTPISPPVSPPRFSDYGYKERSRNGLQSDENDGLSQKVKSQKYKIEELDRKISDLERYSDSLERQLGNKMGNLKDGRIVRELISKNSAQDRTIKNLETLCERYEQDLKQVAKQEEVNQRLIQLLNGNLKKQDQLAETLKSKLELNQPEEKELKIFLRKLPFVKQYYMFFKYGNDYRNIGLFLVNIFTLVLSATVLLNVIKFIYFMLIPMKSGAIFDQTTLEYIYENNDDLRYSILSDYSEGRISVAWWKQIEWLEYLVYQINDWLY